MKAGTADPALRVAVAVPSLLGESPMWHPTEQVLYYCDIQGRQLLRFDPRSGQRQAPGSVYSQLFHLSTTIHRTRILLD